MKPNSKYRERILSLSKRLPAITEKQRKYAYEHCFEKVGYLNKGRVWCLCCGEVFDNIDPDMNEAVCPQCGQKLKIVKSRKEKFDERCYYTIITITEGFQVCRHFIVEKMMRKVNRNIHDCQKPYYEIHEVVQNWIDEKGKETIVARSVRNAMNWRAGSDWDVNKPMEIKIRRKNFYGYDTSSRYDIYGVCVYPWTKVLGKIRRNGYDGGFHDICPNELFKALLTDRNAEMLIKNKQYDLLRFMINRLHLPYVSSIKVCNRHKYIIDDASMWIDYMRLLEYFHLDIHNPHYICPSYLKAAHDRLMDKRRKIEEEHERIKKMKDMAECESKYLSDKAKFFGICFGNKDITISVIQSVHDIYEEGEAMHHCVFTMEYYKNENSLILSARDKEGNRIETIEVDIKNYKLVQSKGVCNSMSDRHDEIIKLVNANMYLIQKANTETRKVV